MHWYQQGRLLTYLHFSDGSNWFSGLSIWLFHDTEPCPSGFASVSFGVRQDPAVLPSGRLSWTCVQQAWCVTEPQLILSFDSFDLLSPLFDHRNQIEVELHYVSDLCHGCVSRCGIAPELSTTFQCSMFIYCLLIATDRAGGLTDYHCRLLLMWLDSFSLSFSFSFSFFIFH